MVTRKKRFIRIYFSRCAYINGMIETQSGQGVVSVQDLGNGAQELSRGIGIS